MPTSALLLCATCDSERMEPAVIGGICALAGAVLGGGIAWVTQRLNREQALQIEHRKDLWRVIGVLERHGDRFKDPGAEFWGAVEAIAHLGNDQQRDAARHLKSLGLEETGKRLEDLNLRSGARAGLDAAQLKRMLLP